mgnify:CR=1 FL=1
MENINEKTAEQMQTEFAEKIVSGVVEKINETEVKSLKEEVKSTSNEYLEIIFSSEKYLKDCEKWFKDCFKKESKNMIYSFLLLKKSIMLEELLNSKTIMMI